MLKTLSQVEEDREMIGGKAFNCALLFRAGFPVPDAIVVPTSATDEVIAQLPDNPWIATQPADARFAVRSSGTEEDSTGHSFAGIHETELNVARDGVAVAVRRCRESGRTSRASTYRNAQHIGGVVPVIAVFVQRMVAAKVSGVAFTVNPVTGADELVVNAAQGLGEALVGGQIEPDEFVISKRDRVVESSRTANGGTPVLTDAQLRELSDLLLRVEHHFGAPQDIEFCHDGNQFWIVQSRPVTVAPITPAPSTPAPSTPAPDTSTQHPAPGTQHPAVVWTRANLAEVLPEQASPQVLAVLEDMLNAAQRMYMGSLLAPFDELGPMFKQFHGRMYINLSQMRRVSRLAGAPFANVLRSLGHPEAITPDDEKPTRAPLREILTVIPDFIRVALKDARAAALYRAHEMNAAQAIARISAVDTDAMSEREIHDVLEWWGSVAPEAMQVVFVMSAVLFRETQIRNACEAVGYSYEKLVYSHLAAGPRSVSGQEAIDLVRLASIAREDERTRTYLLANDGGFVDMRTALAATPFLRAFDAFLDRYGHRGQFESDWSLPRLHENPNAALFAIREQLHSPPQDIDGLTRRQAEAAAEAWREFSARATLWRRLTLLPRIRAMLRRLKQMYVWREHVRYNLARVLRHARRLHLALADRFVQRGWIDSRDDYFLLLAPEIGAATRDPSRGSHLRDIVRQRKAQRLAERDLQMPLVMREDDLPALLRAPRQVSVPDGDLTGLCVSPGSVEAEVVVLLDPGQFADMKRGAILVTRATDPSWTPLFTLASGLIVEVGGMLSHASTIAREYGLPALANVKHATQILATGERILLDATNGRVERIGKRTN